MRRDRLHRPVSTAGSGKKMAVYAGGLVLACGAAYWILHTPGGDAVPVVTADARPVRVRPANPGGLSVNQVGNFIFSSDGDDSDSRLSAPAEAPNTKALNASERGQPKSVKPAGDHLSATASGDTDG